MQTGSSINPTSTCFLISTIAILIGSLGALSGNCEPFPSIEFYYHTLYDLFMWPKYVRKQLTLLFAIVILIGTIRLSSVAIEYLQIATELPSG